MSCCRCGSAPRPSLRSCVSSSLRTPATTLAYSFRPPTICWPDADWRRIQSMGPNLSRPNVLVPLTYFPAGYSLAAAALSSAGLGVGMTVKLLGAAATMLGWWGWARLAQSFIGEGCHAPALEMGRDRDRGLRSAVVHPALGRNRHFPVGRCAVGDRVHGQGIEREHARGLEVRLDGRNALRVCMPDAVCERVSGRLRVVCVMRGHRDCGSGNCSIDRSRSESVCCRALCSRAISTTFVPMNLAVMPGGLFTAHANVFSRLEAGHSVAAQRELPVGILDSWQDCRSVVPFSRQRVPVALGAAARGLCAAPARLRDVPECAQADPSRQPVGGVGTLPGDPALSLGMHDAERRKLLGRPALLLARHSAQRARRLFDCLHR